MKGRLSGARPTITTTNSSLEPGDIVSWREPRFCLFGHPFFWRIAHFRIVDVDGTIRREPPSFHDLLLEMAS